MKVLCGGNCGVSHVGDVGIGDCGGSGGSSCNNVAG